MTGQNSRNILYDGGKTEFRPIIVEPPYHGGLSFHVPPAHLEGFDLSMSGLASTVSTFKIPPAMEAPLSCTPSTMYIAYRNPTVVTALAPCGGLTRMESLRV